MTLKEKRTKMFIEPQQWYSIHDHAQLCQVLERQEIWGETICKVWLPAENTVLTVPASRLRPIKGEQVTTPHHIAYASAAARVADALTRDVLLAPIEASVIPLPHQIHALSTALSRRRVRYLLADEVGLGKTIEAGLIMRELKLRGLVKRTLVIAPRGLLKQWAAEMRTHFSEAFRLLIPGEFSSYRSVVEEDNIWQSFDQIVCPVDSVKPIGKRKGWSEAQVEAYNEERFEDLISAGWDLIIVDEAHRLGGSTEQVARHQLGQGISVAAPYLLLLSATPHQGKRDAFQRLVSLLDPDAFPDVESVTRECVRPFVIRTEKRRAIDAQGDPLFKPRHTQLVPVDWENRHREQRLLYAAVTEYVREGYNQALKEKRNYIGFLMLLLQRLVVSSTRAIHTSLERRLEALRTPHEQLSLFPMLSEEDWADLDGQEQADSLLSARLQALQNERQEVQLLLEAAARCEQMAPDAKAEALLDWIYRLQAEEGDPNLKVLIFTEFVPTQAMLEEFLSQRGFKVVCLNGSLDLDERIHVQNEFAREARIMISTDAGGEGLNLQFCHVVVNYDLPWNPMRLEQRIGRVDRIGQDHPVRALNLALSDSVEHRVREVLEEKLAVIFEELGIDKAGDVLDSAQAGMMFDDLYADAILDPEQADAKIDQALEAIRQQALEAKGSASLLGSTSALDKDAAQKVMFHPMPAWVERMTIQYLQAHGGRTEREDGAWALDWPDGERMPDVVFTGKEAERHPLADHLTLENTRIRDLAVNMPPFVEGQPIPVLSIEGIPAEVIGAWSLWKISISTRDWNEHRILPLFISEEGQVFANTAQAIWDQLLSSMPNIHGYLDAEHSKGLFRRMRVAAEQAGKPLYQELLDAHQRFLARERDKAKHAFRARRRAIDRVGLPEVRHYRLHELKQAQEEFEQTMRAREQVLPDMMPLLLASLDTNKP